MNRKMQMSDTLTTTAPARQTVAPTKGAFEELTVTLWPGWIRARGWYEVYCGAGNTHRVWIDEREELLPADTPGIDVLVGSPIYDITRRLVGWALEDFACDCDYTDWMDR